MPTLTIRINNKTRQRYRIVEKEMSFEDLRNRIVGREGLAGLKRANREAVRAGLRKMTSGQINKEVETVRRAKTGR